MIPSSTSSASPHLANWEEELSPNELLCKKDLEDAALDFFNAKETEDLAETLKFHFQNQKAPFNEEEVEAWYKETQDRIQIMSINGRIGNGVFATAPIANNRPIACYGGIIKEPVADDDKDHEYIWSIEWEKAVRRGNISCQVLVDGSSEEHSNFTRYINGTTKPKDANLDAIWIPVRKKKGQHFIQILYIANKPIAPGQQLLVYYGDGYKWKMKAKRVNPNSYRLVDDGTGSSKVKFFRNASREIPQHSIEIAVEEEEESEIDSPELQVPAILQPPARSRQRPLIPGKHTKLRKIDRGFKKALNDIISDNEAQKTKLLHAMKWLFKNKTSFNPTRRLDKALENLDDPNKFQPIKDWAQKYEERRIQCCATASLSFKNDPSDPLLAMLSDHNDWRPTKKLLFLSKIAPFRNNLPDTTWVEIIKESQNVAKKKYTKKISLEDTPKEQLSEKDFLDRFTFLENHKLASQIAKIALETCLVDARSLAGKHKTTTNNRSSPTLPLASFSPPSRLELLASVALTPSDSNSFAPTFPATTPMLLEFGEPEPSPSAPQSPSSSSISLLTDRATTSKGLQPPFSAVRSSSMNSPAALTPSPTSSSQLMETTIL